ncbi:MAG: hypothetical protein HY585_00325 [Candidatus Omnitrophica bacterium]|nr:hypothetical protein [Candidatus Omnitrophota bacterium]
MKKKNSQSKRSLLKALSGFLTEKQVRLLRNQIHANSFVIDHYIKVIDLLINKERCPKDANTLVFLRQRLSVAIAENDTFRKVLWRHTQLVRNQSPCDGESDAASFLVGRIKSRRQALIAQLARK